MLKEEMSKKDFNKVKKEIKKEIEKQRKKDFDKDVKKILDKELKSFQKENEKEIEDIAINVIQKLVNMLYREKNTWQSKVKKHK